MSEASPAQWRLGHTTPPPEQQRLLTRAHRVQVIGSIYLLSCVVVVYLVMGSSQAMKAAWVEDMLSLVPPLAFLFAVHRARRPRSVSHPYGHHRAVGAGHLAAAVALLAVGLFLVYDSASALVAAERPPIGSIDILGHTVWSGWLMIAAMVYSGVGPIILGRIKLPLAEALHDKVLRADADMSRADWMTSASAIVGILGIGLGIWWADAAAALVISGSILKDGWDQIKGAFASLLDTEVRTVDDEDVHPIIDDILTTIRRPSWVEAAGCRVRDQGHLFHVEVFVIPVGESVTVERCAELVGAVRALDWKLDDVVVVPVAELPPGTRVRPRGLQPEG